ncbi:zinc ribbon domain-containing protein [bacterium]|nr:zinc ribbon domain-containing protein [bacterium]
MKCFYCSYTDEIKEAGFCHGCGKELARLCPVCGIKYDKNARFCMSCGGKLEELPKLGQNQNPSKAAEGTGGGSPRRKLELKMAPSKKEPIKIKMGTGAIPENEDPGEKTLRVQSEPVPRRTHPTIEIRIEEEPKPDLNVGQYKKEKERHTRNTIEIVESEKSATDFITKWEAPKEVVRETKKKTQKTGGGIPDFDELFSELTSIPVEVAQNTAKIPDKKENKESEPLYQEPAQNTAKVPDKNEEEAAELLYQEPAQNTAKVPDKNEEEAAELLYQEFAQNTAKIPDKNEDAAGGLLRVEEKKKPQQTDSQLDYLEQLALEMEREEDEPFTFKISESQENNDFEALEFEDKAGESQEEAVEVLVAEEAPEQPEEAFEIPVAEEAPEQPEEAFEIPVAEEAPEQPEEAFEVSVADEAQAQPEEAFEVSVADEAQAQPEEVFEVSLADEAGKAEDAAKAGETGNMAGLEEAATAADGNVVVRNVSTYKLHPRRVNETYDVSFDRLISETVTDEFKDSCTPMLRKIEQNFRICKGGMFFLRGESGIGKSRFYGNMKAFLEKRGNSDTETFNLVVSDANIFDFDFMIFINLIKKLMKITSNNPAEIAEKFNSLFGDALPDSKKSCLNALICLNFVPIKTKLPKHDIEYLIAYVLYCLSRNKPVLWFVNNANLLNMRTVRFLSNLKSLFDYAPLAVICTVDAEAAVLAEAEPENIYDFKGFDEDKLAKAVFSTVGTNRIPAEMEKLLHEKAGGNMLFAMQLTEYLKDLGLIFDMKGSWRFAKLPDDFNCPNGIDELIAKRAELLSEDLLLTLREFTLLNLYSVPRSFFSLVSTTGSECVDELIKKGFLASDGDSVRFAARAIMTALKKMVKIGKTERTFYRNTVDKLIATNSDIASINKHWLLLSYINSGGIVDKKMNSFLFSSAVYMEKLGFFEISQRSYQTIISSFEADETEDDFRILPEIKNARLWRIVEPQWAKIFWEKLLTYAKQHFDYHLEMLAKSEILLLDEKDINVSAVADIIKKFHTAGCYEDEFRLIDKTTDILIGNGEHLEANTFAVRGYKLLRDVIIKSDGKGVRPAEFIYILYIRSACKLAEICMMLKNYVQATEILEESLNYAEKFGVSYFKSKIMFLLGKIRMQNGEEWEDLVKEGFSNALIGMDFSILKSFFHFFEENGLESREWVEPFLEYKNCMNF